ncbi:hypothetical protein AB9P05_09820 [Roseivirga sp. BDSF3-8]|uniref:hypothetical protein n=1 Tax=Roseivirga sp. BDSF3-8 TaxID=3241598 RepID=UPI003532111F
MKKDKINLKAIEIRSFKTTLGTKGSQMVKGGVENSACRTICYLDCQSGQHSGCTSCGDGGTGGGGGTGATCDTVEIFSCQYAC